MNLDAALHVPGGNELSGDVTHWREIEHDRGEKWPRAGGGNGVGPGASTDVEQNSMAGQIQLGRPCETRRNARTVHGKRERMCQVGLCSMGLEDVGSFIR